MVRNDEGSARNANAPAASRQPRTGPDGPRRAGARRRDRDAALQFGWPVCGRLLFEHRSIRVREHRGRSPRQRRPLQDRVRAAHGGARAILIVAQFGNCTQTLLLAADGSAVLGPGELQIDNKLTTANLTATVEVFDVVSGASFPVDVNVSWTGVGGTTSTRTHTRQTLPGFKVNERFERTFREAIASGTVSDGTTNFTPQPAPPGEALLASVKEGEVDITRQ
jgi:hypothetical protein